MVDRPEPRCVPLEMELLPLYRDPPGSARLRRELKREQRRESGEPTTRVGRLLRRGKPPARRRRRRGLSL